MRAKDPVPSPQMANQVATREATLFDGQRRVLSLLSRGAPLGETLAALCQVLEERLPDAMCSVLLFDEGRGQLHHGAAPSLPESYCRAIDGIAVGPGVGSCGSAAFSRATTIAEDIGEDLRWAPFRQLAQAAGLAACCSVPIIDARDRVLGTFAIYHEKAGPFAARDIDLLRAMTELTTVVIETERRRDALRQSEERFRNAVEQTGQVIYDREPTNGKPVWSGAVAELFGEPVAAIEGYSFEELLGRVHPDDRERVRAALSDSAQAPTKIEYRLRRADGSYADIVQRGVEQLGPDGSLVHTYSVLADVTEQRRAATVLRERQKLESLGLLAGGIAHDFNNLLSAMLGNLGLAQLDLPSENPAQPYLRNVEVAVQRATNLTRQMLAYSGRGQFVVKTVRLSETVREVAALLLAGLSKKVSLNLDLADDGAFVDADVAQLQQVVLNLVSNAAEAVGDGEGVVSISTCVRELDARYIERHLPTHGLQPGRFVVLEVSDTGGGMQPEVMARMFDPFFSTKGASRGLGLAAMAGILRTHRAGIEVRSELGQGTTMTIFFPVSERQLIDKPAEPQAVAPIASGHTVLVVDDERVLRRVASQALGRGGLRVIEACDGIEAVAIVRERAKELSLVIMDLTMPRMGGREAMALIHELAPRLPVILCSGYDQADTLSKLSGPLPAAFLQKPYLLADLQALVSEVLRDGHVDAD